MKEILLACKDLIVDAQISCADLVFKDICLDILSKARLVLTQDMFEELVEFTKENLREEKIAISGRRVKIH